MKDFKWQINYVRAIKYLLSCYQRLGKFNTYLLTYSIYTSQLSDVIHSGQWTATSLDVNVFLYVVVLFFRWCYINEYCKCCLIATAMKFYTNNFIECIYKAI